MLGVFLSCEYGLHRTHSLHQANGQTGTPRAGVRATQQVRTCRLMTGISNLQWDHGMYATHPQVAVTHSCTA